MRNRIDWMSGASTLKGAKFAHFQRSLATYNAARLHPRLPDEAGAHELALEYKIAQAEIAFIEAQRVAIAPLVARAPTDVDGFLAWFEDLKASGPGQGDPLFPWLAAFSTVEQMKWFL